MSDNSPKKAHRGLFRGKRKQTPQKSEPVLIEPKNPIFKQRLPKEHEFLLGYEYAGRENGRAVFKGVGIPQKDRKRHFYIIGTTGAGKTKLLQNLIIQDIVFNRGFDVIDPHGDLIEDVKGWLFTYFKGSFTDNVVLFDPTDPNFTATFNPLECIGDKKDFDPAGQAEKLCLAFEKIWPKAWGDRMADLLRSSLTVLAESELTLAEIPLLLTNDDFRQKVLAKSTDQIAKDYFFGRFNKWTAKTRGEWSESTLNKVNAFLSNKKARHILSAKKSSFNLREIIDGQKILLVNLAKGDLMITGDLLGALLMAKIQMAAFSRTDIPRSERTPFYLYVDEFQNFATKSFNSILEEARKYGLHLILAHQLLSQLPDDLRDTILANCGTQVYFQLSRMDASLLAKEGFRIFGDIIKTMRIGSNSIDPVYLNLSEEWEKYIQILKDFESRECFVLSKQAGMGIEMETYFLDDPHDFHNVSERDFQKQVAGMKIGASYLRSRQSLEKAYIKRRQKWNNEKDPETFWEAKKKTRNKK